MTSERAGALGAHPLLELVDRVVAALALLHRGVGDLAVEVSECGLHLLDGQTCVGRFQRIGQEVTAALSHQEASLLTSYLQLPRLAFACVSSCPKGAHHVMADRRTTGTRILAALPQLYRLIQAVPIYGVDRTPLLRMRRMQCWRKGMARLRNSSYWGRNRR